MQLRVVADTNVIVSAFASGGIPKAILLGALAGDFQLFTSDHILEEVARVLTGRKFRWPPERLLEALAALPARVVDPGPPRLSVIRDLDDNRVLECALAARAHYLVTGDRDLLEVKRYFRTRIVTPREFYSLF
jgi:putative PIN family toxin of toxin-antitoxin system